MPWTRADAQFPTPMMATLTGSTDSSLRRGSLVRANTCSGVSVAHESHDPASRARQRAAKSVPDDGGRVGNSRDHRLRGGDLDENEVRTAGPERRAQRRGDLGRGRHRRGGAIARAAGEMIEPHLTRRRPLTTGRAVDLVVEHEVDEIFRREAAD